MKCIQTSNWKETEEAERYWEQLYLNDSSLGFQHDVNYRHSAQTCTDRAIISEFHSRNSAVITSGPTVTVSRFSKGLGFKEREN